MRVRVDSKSRMKDVDTGAVIYPYDLDIWRDVIELPDGTKGIGDVRSWLRSNYYTGLVEVLL